MRRERRVPVDPSGCWNTLVTDYMSALPFWTLAHLLASCVKNMNIAFTTLGITEVNNLVDEISWKRHAEGED